LYGRVVWQITDVSEVLPPSSPIARMAASILETSINFCKSTQRYNARGHLDIHRRENHKFKNTELFFNCALTIMRKEKLVTCYGLLLLDY
jgi:hypothetical protein